MYFARKRITNLVKRCYNSTYANRFHCPNGNRLMENIEKSEVDTSDLDAEVQSKILYSSILENQKLKLGYTKNSIVQDIINKKAYKDKLEQGKEKPFSSALKYLDMDMEEDSKTSFTNHKELPLSIVNQNQTEVKEFPKFWLNEYEFFDGNEETNVSKYGTNDPNAPPSKIPCNGCGANLHCADPGVPGYIPCEIFKGRTNKELKTIICQRCHFLKHYNIALDVIVKPEEYIQTLSTIKNKFALAVLIVDLLDFPCSMWSEIKEIVGEKRPVILVGNKVDLLPKDSKDYLSNIKSKLYQTALDFGLNKLNLKQTCLISAKTGYGVEELITQLHKIWGHTGDVYLIGCANVGKSSLFNALLRSDYCKVEASDLIKKATTCPWPGTTLKMLKFPILRPSDIKVYERFLRLKSERLQRSAEQKLQRDKLRETGKIKDATLTGHIGMTFKETFEVNDAFSTPEGIQPILTLDENSYSKSKWCYDTPGVINPEQIHNLLTTEELILMNPTQTITPRAFRISKQMTIFLAGLGRLDYINGDLEYIKLYVFSAMKLPVLITHTSNADYMYNSLLGSKYLGVPLGNNDRLNKWPNLESSEIVVDGSIYNEASSDIVLSSAGWISFKIPTSKKCQFLAWTPQKRGIFMRTPALVRYPDKICGDKIRNSLAYKVGKPFILTANS